MNTVSLDDPYRAVHFDSVFFNVHFLVFFGLNGSGSVLLHKAAIAAAEDRCRNPSESGLPS